ncbi:39S ribosomal protein L51, mitochondrial [Thalassophryne amazonica]|uniref:39S ribosomal protein L51, mitochondrial n=1 Tax=Thalassophryne amazonica TaxID=390379 RepID=UPI001471646B|nr:39S ribosomal protein L51, mitochondrial [Thalassophryne amazonica]XP_034030401.1 39S ribosomal protein L51, mitochondrial [Thalassophryne amazonica]
MSVLGGLLRPGAFLCQSAETLIHSTRTIFTGTCRQLKMDGVPQPKAVDRWTEKRAMFGVYDNIDILGEFKAHPRDLIVGPCWLKGFRGNELQRLIRKKKMVGDRMMVQDKHNLEKRIRYLYKRFNRYGKHR